MSMDLLHERLRRYEAALEEIADRVEDQLALEEHQQCAGLPEPSIAFGRADAYRKIVHVAGAALGKPVKVLPSRRAGTTSCESN